MLRTSIDVDIAILPAIMLTVSPVSAASSCGDFTTTASSSTTDIDFEHLSSGTARKIAGQRLTVSTNASSGYGVYLSSPGDAVGRATGQSLADVSGTNTAPQAWPAAGVEAFGYSTEATTLTGNPTRFHPGQWAQLTSSRDEVMRSPTGTSSDTACVAFGVSMSAMTPADTFQAVITYTVVPTF